MSLLFDDQPMVVLPSLAKELENLNEAVFLQQLHYWLQIKKQEGRNYIEGRYWVFNSLDEWLKQFVWMSKMTLRRTISSLVAKGFVVTGNFNRLKMDHTTWYTINYECIRLLEAKVEKERAENSEKALMKNNSDSVSPVTPSSDDRDSLSQNEDPTGDSPKAAFQSRCVQSEQTDVSDDNSRYAQSEHFDMTKMNTSECSDCTRRYVQNEPIDALNLNSQIPEITVPENTAEISSEINTNTTTDGLPGEGTLLLPETAEKPVPFQKIIAMYNAICTSFPAAVRLTPERERHIRARFREYGGDIATFERVFRLAEESDFLSGRSKAWDKADLDWIIKPSNFAKIIEGKYSNVSSRKLRWLTS